MVLTDISSTIRSLSDEQFEKLNLFVAGIEVGLGHSTAAGSDSSADDATDTPTETPTESAS